jgi:hypothetical protein
VSVLEPHTLAQDDEQARRARLLLLGKGAALAHRFDHRLTAGLDELHKPRTARRSGRRAWARRRRAWRCDPPEFEHGRSRYARNAAAPANRNVPLIDGLGTFAGALRRLPRSGAKRQGGDALARRLLVVRTRRAADRHSDARTWANAGASRPWFARNARRSPTPSRSKAGEEEAARPRSISTSPPCPSQQRTLTVVLMTSRRGGTRLGAQAVPECSKPVVATTGRSDGPRRKFSGPWTAPARSASPATRPRSGR